MNAAIRAAIALGLVAATCAPAPREQAVAVPATPHAAALASADPTPLASATPLTTPPPLPRCPGAFGGEMVALCIAGARVDLDASIAEADVRLILTQVTQDLAAAQREFEWTLRSAPRIDVYGTPARYAAGLRDIFGYSPITADYLADNSVAFFEPSLLRIAVSWDALRDRRPIAAIRHELMHAVTLEACAPRCDLVPAWLNEGWARLSEATMPGSEWRLMRVRYEAASMVSTRTLLPLTALWTQQQWNAIGDWAGYYKYQQAARATELLRDDIGERAIARLYARIRAGQDVPAAYAALSGRSFAAFTATLAERFAGGIAPGAGIVSVAPGADGRNASYLLYGFPPEARVTLRIHSRSWDTTETVELSPQGAYFASFDDALPPGAYTITAASGGAVAAVSVVKRGGRARRPVD